MTLNNPGDVATQEYLEKIHTELKATYTVGQLESGEEGTPHIQFFMNFPNSIRCSKIKAQDKRLHIETVKVNNGADTYCMKEDTRVEGPYEFGTKPVKRNSKTDWERVYELAAKGSFEEIPSDIKVKHYGNLQKISKDNLTIKDSADTRGVWIYGDAGVGKSRMARELHPVFYPKLCNKWFDGYKG